MPLQFFVSHKNATEYVWTQPGLSCRRIRRRILHHPVTDTRAPHVIFFFLLSLHPDAATATTSSSTPAAREQQQHAQPWRAGAPPPRAPALPWRTELPRGHGARHGRRSWRARAPPPRAAIAAAPGAKLQPPEHRLRGRGRWRARLQLRPPREEAPPRQVVMGLHELLLLAHSWWRQRSSRRGSFGPP